MIINNYENLNTRILPVKYRYKEIGSNQLKLFQETIGEGGKPVLPVGD